MVERRKSLTYSHSTRHERDESETEIVTDFKKKFLFICYFSVSLSALKIGLTHILKSSDEPGPDPIKATCGSEPLLSCSRTNDKSERSSAREPWPTVVNVACNEIFVPLTLISASQSSGNSEKMYYISCCSIYIL